MGRIWPWLKKRGHYAPERTERWDWEEGMVHWIPSRLHAASLTACECGVLGSQQRTGGDGDWTRL